MPYTWGEVNDMDNGGLINKALGYIGREWNSADISLEKVAEHAGFSVAYFDRLFAEHTGKSVMEYVRTYKLIQAAQLLRTGDRSIIDIALELGYSNPENFARAFRGHYGLPPSEYRATHRDIELTWKDLSTGTVIQRFEKTCPGLRRVDPDELTDFLLAADPLSYAAQISAISGSDSAVCALSENNEYIAVEEYSADDVSLTLFCREENIGDYVRIAKKFPKYAISFTCGKEYTLPPDKYGLEDDRILELYNYAYLKDGIETLSRGGFTIRELTAEDEKAAEDFSKHGIPVVAGVFRQKFKYSKRDSVRLLGMLDGKKLAGCALVTFEQARSIRISDTGGIFFLPEYDTAENRETLWTHAVSLALGEGYLPVNGGAPYDNGASERLGYTLVSKRYAFMHAG